MPADAQRNCCVHPQMNTYKPSSNSQAGGEQVAYPVKKWQPILLNPKAHRRARKRAIIAFARQRLIGLWCWKTGQGWRQSENQEKCQQKGGPRDKGGVPKRAGDARPDLGAGPERAARLKAEHPVTTTLGKRFLALPTAVAACRCGPYRAVEKHCSDPCKACLAPTHTRTSRMI